MAIELLIDLLELAAGWVGRSGRSVWLTSNSPLPGRETMSSTLCQVCGNDVDSQLTACPHCGTTLHRRPVPREREKYRTVNLKFDMPTVDKCRQRMHQELGRARADGLQAVKFIHGYGSSGTGGKLRHAVRRSLDGLCREGKIGEVVYGEDLRDKKSALVKRLPLLKQDLDLKRANKGVTLVMMN